MILHDKIPSWNLLHQPEHYEKAATHATSEAFRERQRQRMAAMQQREAESKPKPMLKAVRGR